jgi:hypothetical protein
MAVSVTGNIRARLGQRHRDCFAQPDGCSGNQRSFSIQTKMIENAHQLITPED